MYESLKSKKLKTFYILQYLTNITFEEFGFLQVIYLLPVIQSYIF